jgi:hypothetical protein
LQIIEHTGQKMSERTKISEFFDNRALPSRERSSRLRVAFGNLGMLAKETP